MPETREICKRGKVLTLFSTLSLICKPLLVNIVLSDLGKIFIVAFIEHLWLVQTVQTVQTSTVSAIIRKKNDRCYCPEHNTLSTHASGYDQAASIQLTFKFLQ